jgi:hypothetical protein
VRRAIDKTGRPPATVRYLDDRLPNGFIKVVLAIRNKDKEIQVCLDSPVQVERSTPCGMPVCENHLRRVEPGVEYCADHWHGWEAVA